MFSCTQISRKYCSRSLNFLFTAVSTCIMLLAVAISDVFCQTKWEFHPDGPVVELGTNGSWDDSWLEPIAVVKVGDTYSMWYFAYNRSYQMGIGLAISSDGINWEKYSGNPIMTKGKAGSWDDAGIGMGAVLIIKDTFYFWFYGWNQKGTQYGIGLATSSDGVNWTEYEKNPIFYPGVAEAWDDYASVQYPSVIYDGETYHMWYGGCRNEFKIQGYMLMKIGYATSPDGITWTPDEDNPVLEEGSQSGNWDYWKVEMPTVVENRTGFHMWFHGDAGQSQIGYAYSGDGIYWTKYLKNPVLSPRKAGNWTLIGLMRPVAFFDEIKNTYNLYYMGGSLLGGRIVSQIGLATSKADPVAPVFDRDMGHSLPQEFMLYQNYPNPFNPSTTIEFFCPYASYVSLEIYNLLGHKVKTLVSEQRPAGVSAEVWHAVDDVGRPVSAGNYIAVFKTERCQQKIKLTVVK